MRIPYFVKKNIWLFEVTFTDRGSCMVVVVVRAASALVIFLPHSEHVDYRFSPKNYHVRKKGN